MEEEMEEMAEKKLGAPRRPATAPAAAGMAEAFARQRLRDERERWRLAKLAEKEEKREEEAAEGGKDTAPGTGMVDAARAARQMQIWKKAFPLEDAAVRFPAAAAVLGPSLFLDVDDPKARAMWEGLDEDVRVDIVDSAGLEQRVFGELNSHKWPSTAEVAPWTGLLPRILPPGLSPEHSLTERDDGLSVERAAFACALDACDTFSRAKARTGGSAAELNKAADAFAQARVQDPFAAPSLGDGGWKTLTDGPVKDAGLARGLPPAQVARAKESAAWILLARSAGIVEERACAARAQARPARSGYDGDVWERLEELKRAGLSKPGGRSP